jgi:hypothetical protein
MNYLIMPPKPPSKSDKIKMFLKRIWCSLFGHKLTCAAEQGKDPTPEQVAKGVEGFFEYAEVYCKRCDYKYKLDND